VLVMISLYLINCLSEEKRCGVIRLRLRMENSLFNLIEAGVVDVTLLGVLLLLAGPSGRLKYDSGRRSRAV